MKNLEAKVDKALAAAGVDPSARIGVALSGGADSVALLAALTALGYDCVALHCNFHLRGAESNRDQAHAERIAARLGAPIEVEHFDVDAHRRITDESVEMACRTLRYRWFGHQRAALQLNYIAVGHNLTDNIETFFLNLLRGTSLAGLTGMPLLRVESHVLRPLLESTRSEIEAYVTARGLTYIIDSTNLENQYLRNRLRNIILPTISRSFPDAMAGILTTMANLSENRELYTHAAAQIISSYTNSHGHIEIERMASAEPQAALLLFEHLKPKGFNAAQAKSMIEAAAESGRTFTSNTGTRVVTDRGRLIEVAPQTAEPSLDSIDIAIRPIAEFRPERNPAKAYFSPDVLAGNPIEVRSWQHADRLKPFGMRGSKLVSDIFSDAHTPIHIKPLVPIVVKDDEVIWVAGLKNSRLFAVDPARHSHFVEMTLLSKF